MTLPSMWAKTKHNSAIVGKCRLKKDQSAEAERWERNLYDVSGQNATGPAAQHWNDYVDAFTCEETGMKSLGSGHTRFLNFVRDGAWLSTAFF